MYKLLILLRRSWCSTCIITGFLFPALLAAQSNRIDTAVYRIRLSEAIEFSRNQNKWVQAARMEMAATEEDRKDGYKAALPSVNINGSYQRFSNLTLFTDGLSHSTTAPRKPTSNGAALGAEALFNFYSGGRQKALESEQDARVGLAKVNAQELTGNAVLQTAVQYLEMVKLYDQQRLLNEQLKRARTRLDNINALYHNEKVTRSDVLRAEVMLSNVELGVEQNNNDIIIANQRLNVIMNLPDSVCIIPADSAGISGPDPDSLLPLIEGGVAASYPLHKAAENILIQQAKIKGVQSANMPSVSLYAAYGLTYPNYLFFPPVDQAYALGFVGVKAQYSLSSLYHNKSKLSAAKLRLKELGVQQQATTDQVRTTLQSYYIKYKEALNRIIVNRHSVEQAQVNLKIVSTKYFNQLALLTDLLDADNLYQESRFSLVQAQVDAIGIYHYILYTSGQL